MLHRLATAAHTVVGSERNIDSGERSVSMRLISADLALRAV
jgi:hypothetical protein